MYNMTDQTVNADFAFEVSWEVCNKVGGIHTVLESLASTLSSVLDGNLIFFRSGFGNIRIFRR